MATAVLLDAWQSVSGIFRVTKIKRKSTEGHSHGFFTLFSKLTNFSKIFPQCQWNFLLNASGIFRSLQHGSLERIQKEFNSLKTKSFCPSDSMSHSFDLQSVVTSRLSVTLRRERTLMGETARSGRETDAQTTMSYSVTTARERTWTTGRNVTWGRCLLMLSSLQVSLTSVWPCVNRTEYRHFQWMILFSFSMLTNISMPKVWWYMYEFFFQVLKPTWNGISIGLYWTMPNSSSPQTGNYYYWTCFWYFFFLENLS